MTLFRLDASIRTEGSLTRAVADSAEAAWREVHPDRARVHRDLALAPIPATAWSLALWASQIPEADRTPEQAEAVALSATLADEMLGADAYLFAVPLYNFGVSQHFKTWADLLLADPRFAPGTTPLAGKPAVVVTARGGGYGPGTPREGWDHATPWYKRVLGDVLGLKLHVSEIELTMAEDKPEMAALLDLARESAAAAHRQAEEHGRLIAAALAAAA